MGSDRGRPLFVRIGPLELDERKRELRGPSGPLAVQPKVFDVLVCLVRERDGVVTRGELQHAVWPDTAVGPDSITRALREIRRLVGRDMVRTYPSRGVRFVGPIVELEPAPVGARAVEPDGVVGVDLALQSIDAALARSRHGAAFRVLIGAPGTGKSTLLEVAARRARAAGISVIRAPSDAALERIVGEAAQKGSPIAIIQDDLVRGGDTGRIEADALARAVGRAPIVVFASCCTAARRDARIMPVLVAAMRIDPDAIVTLGPLPRAALSRVAAQVLGRSVSPAALSKLAALTGGNPRLATTVLHHVKHAARPLETVEALLPTFADRLREIVLAHVSVVGADARALVAAISILSEPFSIDVAADTAAIGRGSAADALAEVAAAGILVEEPASRWRFASDLVRSVLERDLAPSERAACHARAGQALERWLGTPPTQIERIARHYVAGASVAHAERALELSRRAATISIEAHRFASAVRWLESALDIEALVEPSSPPRRAVLWIELAKALARDGQVERAAEAFAASSDIGRERRGDAMRTAFAAIAPELPSIVERFYQLLFERHPQVRPMFVRPAPLQRRMFGEAFAVLADRVDDPEWLRGHLEELGRRHAEYGVTDEMYGWARVAFLDAVESALAPRRLGPDVRRAWERTLDMIETTMQAGGRSVLAHAEPTREPNALAPRRRASGR